MYRSAQATNVSEHNGLLALFVVNAFCVLNPHCAAFKSHETVLQKKRRDRKNIRCRDISIDDYTTNFTIHSSVTLALHCTGCLSLTHSTQPTSDDYNIHIDTHSHRVIRLFYSHCVFNINITSFLLFFMCATFTTKSLIMIL